MTRRARARHEPTGIRRWIRPVVGTAAALALLVFLAMTVFPTRTWIEQRQALAETSHELDELDAERDALEARIEALDDDEELELIARSQFGLVLPGEEAYSVLPPPVPPVDLPTIWPYGDVDDPASTVSATPGPSSNQAEAGPDDSGGASARSGASATPQSP